MRRVPPRTRGSMATTGWRTSAPALGRSATPPAAGAPPRPLWTPKPGDTLGLLRGGGLIRILPTMGRLPLPLSPPALLFGVWLGLSEARQAKGTTHLRRRAPHTHPQEEVSGWRWGDPAQPAAFFFPSSRTPFPHRPLFRREILSAVAGGGAASFFFLTASILFGRRRLDPLPPGVGKKGLCCTPYVETERNPQTGF